MALAPRANLLTCGQRFSQTRGERRRRRRRRRRLRRFAANRGGGGGDGVLFVFFLRRVLQVSLEGTHRANVFAGTLGTLVRLLGREGEKCLHTPAHHTVFSIPIRPRARRDAGFFSAAAAAAPPPGGADDGGGGGEFHRLVIFTPFLLVKLLQDEALESLDAPRVALVQSRLQLVSPLDLRPVYSHHQHN